MHFLRVTAKDPNEQASVFDVSCSNLICDPRARTHTHTWRARAHTHICLCVCACVFVCMCVRARACVCVCVCVFAGTVPGDTPKQDDAMPIGMLVRTVEALDDLFPLFMCIFLLPSLASINLPCTPCPLYSLSSLSSLSLLLLSPSLPKMESILLAAQGGSLKPAEWAAMNFDEQEMKQMEVARREAAEFEQVWRPLHPMLHTLYTLHPGTPGPTSHRLNPHPLDCEQVKEWMQSDDPHGLTYKPAPKSGEPGA